MEKWVRGISSSSLCLSFGCKYSKGLDGVAILNSSTWQRMKELGWTPTATPTRFTGATELQLENWFRTILTQLNLNAFNSIFVLVPTIALLVSLKGFSLFNCYKRGNWNEVKFNCFRRLWSENTALLWLLLLVAPFLVGGACFGISFSAKRGFR